ncbi:uncharacterized protein AB675_3514 [Cyphellophora attinorum]|uniref:Pyridoxal phosphate homeostasis protein n=1 Tax=Cyphellophora attinorum TaxID=1664694 RepID=A0A0N1HPT7_9EURO|nr:uncharacterized protein AB675_3514 [Phialophora attinorum]KPI39814.1 hypothetical protein AB675_3514 [Phialophora attinorum]
MTSSNDPSTAENNSNSSESDMPPLRVDPSRLSTLKANIASIHSRIQAATSSSQHPPRLVAVSKLKPATDILALASSSSTSTENDSLQPPPQRHFGENYVQELLEKSKILWDAEHEGTKVGRRIRWHFIGGLQSNKATQLARDAKGLWCVESVDSEKKARGLSKGWEGREWLREEGQDVSAANGAHDGEGDDGRLRIFIQVNTSGEENKSGVEPDSDELLTLAKCIRDDCSQTLKLQGLMTIGAIARSQAAKEGEENEDFVKLKEVRTWLAKELGLDGGEEELELSMGMSDDFESAIRLGSSEVRIGSTIFGERPPRSEAKVV